MENQLTDLIVARLNESKEHLQQAFSRAHPIKVARHFVLDNLLPTDLAEKIYADFPLPKKMKWLKNGSEIKLKYSHIKHTSTLLQNLHHAFQNPRVVAVVEEITQIKKQVPDKSRIAGGISAMLKGGFINPHLDNSHDIDKKLYRTVNLLYYVSPNWQEENGGNYELWDETVENRIIVPSFFNRLVVMETNRKSWHAVNRVLCDAPRCCVFNYYFSEQSPEGEDYFHTASLLFNRMFKARPEQKIRRAIARVTDTLLKKLYK